MGARKTWPLQGMECASDGLRRCARSISRWYGTRDLRRKPTRMRILPGSQREEISFLVSFVGFGQGFGGGRPGLQPGDSKFAAQIGQLVDFDWTHDVHEREFLRFGRDDDNAGHLFVFHTEEDVDIFAIMFAANSDDARPRWRSELRAKRLYF